MHLTFTCFKYEYVSAFEGAPDGLSEGKPNFQVEIKGAC